MADSYVCSGATMKCTMGTSTARLTVLPIRTVFLTGQPMANISDHLTMVNLAPFGRCRSLGFPATAAATAAHHGHLTPMPCMHNTPFPWMNGKNDYIVKGDPALLKSSTCQCMWGGTISLVTDGQTPTGPADMSKKHPVIFAGADLNQIASSVDADIPKQPLDEYPLPPRANVDQDDFVLYFEKSSVDKLLVESKKNSRIENVKKQITSTGKGNEILSNSAANQDKDKKNGLEWPKYREANYGNNCGTTSNAFLLNMMPNNGYGVVAARGVVDTESNKTLADSPYSLWTNNPPGYIQLFQEPEDIDQPISERYNKIASELNNKHPELKQLFDSLSELQNNPEHFNNQKMLYDERLKVQFYKDFLAEACEKEGYYLFGLQWDNRVKHMTIIKSYKDQEGNMLLERIEPQKNEVISIDETVKSMINPWELESSDCGVMRVLDLNGNLVDGLQINEDLLDAFTSL